MASIKIIDISPFIENNNEEAKKQCAKEVFEACSTIGFFHVSNYQKIISEQLKEEALKVLRDFFSLPLEEKIPVIAGEYVGMDDSL